MEKWKQEEKPDYCQSFGPDPRHTRPYFVYLLNPVPNSHISCLVHFLVFEKKVVFFQVHFSLRISYFLIFFFDTDSNFFSTYPIILHEFIDSHQIRFISKQIRPFSKLGCSGRTRAHTHAPPDISGRPPTSYKPRRDVIGDRNADIRLDSCMNPNQSKVTIASDLKAEATPERYRCAYKDSRRSHPKLSLAAEIQSAR